MAGLLDLFGGDGSADDPYADILTPAQRNQMQVQGLLAMAGAFADAAMPSRLPIPFGAALGKAAAALGAGTDAGMTSALAGAYKAQQIRDLRAKAALQGKLNPIFQDILNRVRGGQGGGAVLEGGGQGAVPRGTALPGGGAAPTADAPLTMLLPYPDAAAGGLLGTGRDAGYGGEPNAAGGLLGEGRDAGFGGEMRMQALPEATSGSSTAPAEPDAGAGGDTLPPAAPAPVGNGLLSTPWGPVWPGSPGQGGAAGSLAFSRNPADTYWTPEGRAALQPTEGRYDQIHYPSGNPSTASGGFGYLDRTWREFAPKAGVDLAQYPRAYMAPAAVQDAVAAITPIEHWTGVDAQGKPFNANAQRLAANPAYVTGAPAPGGRPAATEGSGGGEPPGWGPTFPQGPLQALRGGGVGGLPLAPPSTLPRLAPPGSAGAPGAGGKIPGLNISPQELAVIDAMAESAGLGNPFKGLLDTYYKSPGYQEESAGATARGRIAVEEPSQLRVQAAKARLDMVQKLSEQGLTLDNNNNPVEIPGMREMLGKTAGELERAKQEAQSQFQLTDARVIGPDGQPTTTKMPIYEYIFRQQQGARNTSMGAKPQPGDIISSPISGPPPEGFQYRMDPNGNLTAEPIRGTPAEEVVKERNRKQAVADQAALVARDIMVQNSNRIEDLVMNSSLPVTGTAGPFLSRIGGTAANDVRVMIETMKARASLDQLNQMRNSNPTGAGLGTVSNQEGDRLAAAIANLDQSQTKEQFLFNLRRAKEVYIDLIHGPGTYSKLSDEPVLKVPSMSSGNQPIDKAAYDRLPSGSPFIAPDGSRRIKP